MKMNKKRYVWILVALAIYFVIFLIVKGTSGNKEEPYSMIVFDNNDTWIYKNDKWSILYESDYKQYNWKKFNVYSNNKLLGKYSLYYHNEWYVFDDNKQSITVDGSLFATGGNTEIRTVEFTAKDINPNTDTFYINKILEENNISTSVGFTIQSVVDIDIDNDGIIEKIYTISNIFSTDASYNTIFNIIFLRKDEKLYTIYKSIVASSDMYDECKPYVSSIIDFDDDKNYELIIGCGYYSDLGVKNTLYKYNKRSAKFIKLISHMK